MSLFCKLFVLLANLFLMFVAIGLFVDTTLVTDLFDKHWQLTWWFGFMTFLNGAGACYIIIRDIRNQAQACVKVDRSA